MNLKTPFTYEEKKVLVALLSCEWIGRKTLLKLVSFSKINHLSLSEFWTQPTLCSDTFRLSERQLASVQLFKNKYSIDGYLNYLSSKNISVIFEQDSLYPPLLRQIEDRPLLFFAKGKLSFVCDLPIAVVGSRGMTSYGQSVTEKIVGELISYQAQIISGGMYGIDSQAHQVCLDKGGETVCILGYGFDYYYPLSHRSFLESILDRGGTLLTEFAPSVVPKPGNFPVRNRIVAGMSLGTLVVEAALKSGSLITAHLAAEYGREVFAVPGPISNPFCEGTKELINEGAKLISSGAEIIEELQHHYRQLVIPENQKNSYNQSIKIDQKELLKSISFESATHQTVYQTLQSQTVTTDELCRMIQLPVAQLSCVLTDLELEGMIEKSGEGWRIR